MTDTTGAASVEAPLGKLEASIGQITREAWVGVDRATEITVVIG